MHIRHQDFRNTGDYNLDWSYMRVSHLNLTVCANAAWGVATAPNMHKLGVHPADKIM